MRNCFQFRSGDTNTKKETNHQEKNFYHGGPITGPPALPVRDVHWS